MQRTHGKQTSLVGPEVVAEILGVSRNTVLNWARDGKIPSIQVGRIYRFFIPDVAQLIGIPSGALVGIEK